jgi:predicted ABC-class ATPase
MELPAALETDFQQELADYEQERRMKYITSIERMAIQKGRQEEAVRWMEKLLQRKFSTSSPELQARLQKLDVDQLEMLLDEALIAESSTQLLAQLTAIETASTAKPKGKRSRSKTENFRAD